MKANKWWAVLLCGAALAVPVRAQDEPEAKPDAPAQAPAANATSEAPKAKPYEEPPLKRWGGLVLKVGGWYTGFSGADYRTAYVFQSGRQGVVSQTLELPSDSVLRATAQVDWLLPGARGAVELAWDSIRNSAFEQKLTPGNFQYGELAVLPEYAGVGDDGLTDGFRAQSLTKSRRFRLEFASTPFVVGHVRGRWHAGIHSVDYSRHFQVQYYALAPNLPPTIPPVFGSGGGVSPLTPHPDMAISDSTFSGTGPAAGLDLAYEIVPRVDLIGGFSIGILDGELNTTYSSTTSTYYLAPSLTNPGGFLSYAELVAALDDPNLAGLVSQIDAPFNLANNHSGHIAEDFEAYIGIEGRIWKELRGYVRFRGLVFANIAADERPTAVYYSTDVSNFAVTAAGTSQEPISAGYVGFELGFSYRF